MTKSTTKSNHISTGKGSVTKKSSLNSSKRRAVTFDFEASVTKNKMDDALQPTQQRRRYMRRGSKTSSMMVLSQVQLNHPIQDDKYFPETTERLVSTRGFLVLADALGPPYVKSASTINFQNGSIIDDKSSGSKLVLYR